MTRSETNVRCQYTNNMPGLIFLLVITTSFLIWFTLRPSHRLRIMGEKIPGPRAWPIIGNSFIFYKTDRLFQTILNLVATYGPVSRLWFGNQLWVVLQDPNDIEVFLASSKQLNKGSVYKFTDSWLGNGLTTSNGEIWRRHRKLLTSSFHFKILESYVETMQRNATVLCDKLEDKVDGEEFNIRPYAQGWSLDVIVETTMGEKVGAHELSGIDYKRSVQKLTTILVERFTSPLLFYDFVFRLSSLGRAYYRELKNAKTFVNKVIEERKKHLKNEVKVDICNNGGTNGRKGGMSLLNFMLLESNFTDEEIENEVQTFIFAGLEAVTTTVSFCIYALSRHQDVQEKLYQEIRNSLDENNEELTYEDCNKLQYLDCVINETLRLYTPVPAIARKVSEDIALPSGFILPKDSQANILLYVMHNDEKYFANPHEFRPQRFENKENSEKFTFFPFSAGPRNCLGTKFAKLEVKIAIWTLLRKYKFLPSKKVQSLILDAGINLQARNNEYPVRITLRDTSKKGDAVFTN